jgi:hypothetical protein
MISLERARWRLAIIWFPGCALLFVLLVLQSMGGAYGSELQRVWGWALPNFLPTLALMVSVFAADALKPSAGGLIVRRHVLNLSVGLSLFYLFMLLLTIFAQPLIMTYSGNTAIERVEMLETSNLWLGPVQGLVVVALGVLFFLKEEDAAAAAVAK